MCVYSAIARACPVWSVRKCELEVAPRAEITKFLHPARSVAKSGDCLHVFVVVKFGLQRAGAGACLPTAPFLYPARREPPSCFAGEREVIRNPPCTIITVFGHLPLVLLLCSALKPIQIKPELLARKGEGLHGFELQSTRAIPSLFVIAFSSPK